MPLVPDPRELPRALERATRFVDELVGLVPRASALLTSAEELLERAHRLLGRIEETRARAARTEAAAAAEVADLGLLVERASGLLSDLEPSLVRMRPTLDRLGDTAGAGDVDAALHLVSSLQNVGPDLRELLEIASELNGVLGRVPGMGRLRKRVEEPGAQPS